MLKKRNWRGLWSMYGLVLFICAVFQGLPYLNHFLGNPLTAVEKAVVALGAYNLVIPGFLLVFVTVLFWFEEKQ